VVDHGRVLSSESARLSVQMVGVPSFIASLARQQGAVHGLLAVVIAIVCGFLVGILFKK
jgi:hypothetical protein